MNGLFTKVGPFLDIGGDTDHIATNIEHKTTRITKKHQESYVRFKEELRRSNT